MNQLGAELLIRDVYARKIFDCEGNPTVEVEVLAGDETVGRVPVPSGIEEKKGGHTERTDRTDSEIEIVNTYIARELIGRNIFDQQEIDRVLTAMDENHDEGIMMRRVLFGLSAAAASAAAAAVRLPLHRYLGGVHAKTMPIPVIPAADRKKRWRQSGIYLIPDAAFTPYEQLEICMKISSLTESLSGDIRKILQMLKKTVAYAGFQAGKDITFGISGYGSERYDRGQQCYRLPDETGKKEKEVCRSSREMADYYGELASEAAVSLISDPLDSEDWEGWALITERLGKEIRLEGETLFQSDISRFEKGRKTGAANTLVIRPDHTGTLTNMSELIKTAQKSGYSITVAHNAGETAGTLIADLAVAYRADRIRAGYPIHMENTEKYNQLIRIWERTWESG